MNNQETMKIFYELATNDDASSQERLQELINAKSDSSEQMVLQLMTKLAKQNDYESFEAAILTDEIPPMELTEEELQFLKGGSKADFALGFLWGLVKPPT